MLRVKRAGRGQKADERDGVSGPGCQKVKLMGKTRNVALLEKSDQNKDPVKMTMKTIFAFS